MLSVQIKKISIEPILHNIRTKNTSPLQLGRKKLLQEHVVELVDTVAQELRTFSHVLLILCWKHDDSKHSAALISLLFQMGERCFPIG